SVVVTCRDAEYESLASKLLLGAAIAVQPLTPEKIDDYLASGGATLAGLRAALAADSALQEMAETPLLLYVLALAYEGVPPTPFASLTTRQPVFAVYVERMLRRRQAGGPWTPQQTRHWLAWLAGQMVAHGQTVFYFVFMRSDWLPGSARRLFQLLIRLL